MNEYSHYQKSVEHLNWIDVYRVLVLFGVTNPCLQHAIKKLLCAGQRTRRARSDCFIVALFRNANRG